MITPGICAEVSDLSHFCLKTIAPTLLAIKFIATKHLKTLIRSVPALAMKHFQVNWKWLWQGWEQSRIGRTWVCNYFAFFTHRLGRSLKSFWSWCFAARWSLLQKLQTPTLFFTDLLQEKTSFKIKQITFSNENLDCQSNLESRPKTLEYSFNCWSWMKLSMKCAQIKSQKQNSAQTSESRSISSRRQRPI